MKCGFGSIFQIFFFISYLFGNHDLTCSFFVKLSTLTKLQQHRIPSSFFPFFLPQNKLIPLLLSTGAPSHISTTTCIRTTFKSKLNTEPSIDRWEARIISRAYDKHRFKSSCPLFLNHKAPNCTPFKLNSSRRSNPRDLVSPSAEGPGD